VGVRPLSLSSLSWLPEWPSCGIYINISCKYFTEGSRCGTVRSVHVHKGALILFTNSLFRFLFHFMFLQSLIVVSW
jgi:hypothetical protein